MRSPWKTAPSGEWREYWIARLLLLFPSPFISLYHSSPFPFSFHMFPLRCYLHLNTNSSFLIVPIPDSGRFYVLLWGRAGLGQPHVASMNYFQVGNDKTLSNNRKNKNKDGNKRLFIELRFTTFHFMVLWWYSNPFDTSFNVSITRVSFPCKIN